MACEPPDSPPEPNELKITDKWCTINCNRCGAEYKQLVPCYCIPDDWDRLVRYEPIYEDLYCPKCCDKDIFIEVE